MNVGNNSNNGNVQPQNQYVYYNPEYVVTPFGMDNPGAVCWCNSVLQMFFGLSSLNQVMLQYDYEFVDNPFALEYIKVLKATLPNSPTLPPPDTSNLNLASTAILRMFMKQAQESGIKVSLGRGQECVDEAFTLFIDMIKNWRVEKLFKNIYNVTIVCPSCKKISSEKRDSSYQIHMFTKLKLNTEILFRDWLKIHPVRCEYFVCDCGHKITDFDREEKLRRLSEIIIITMDKFYQKELRWFPEKLSFKAAEGSDIQYELVGKIEHSGTMNSGHYWCHSRRNGVWKKFNDSSVSAGDSRPTTSTFMIAYQMIKPE